MTGRHSLIRLNSKIASFRSIRKSTGLPNFLIGKVDSKMKSTRLPKFYQSVINCKKGVFPELATRQIDFKATSSVTRLGDFYKFLATNCITVGDFLGYF